MPPEYDITQEHYDFRHDEEVAISDEVCAYQVNNSIGTQDTINKAQTAGLKLRFTRSTISRQRIRHVSLLYMPDSAIIKTNGKTRHEYGRSNFWRRVFLVHGGGIQELKGVVSVAPGYAGGTKNPTYDEGFRRHDGTCRSDPY